MSMIIFFLTEYASDITALIKKYLFAHVARCNGETFIWNNVFFCDELLINLLKTIIIVDINGYWPVFSINDTILTIC